MLSSFTERIGRTILNASVPSFVPAVGSTAPAPAEAADDEATRSNLLSSVTQSIGMHVIRSSPGLANDASGLSSAGSKVGSQVSDAAAVKKSSSEPTTGFQTKFDSQSTDVDDEAHKGHAASSSNLLSSVTQSIGTQVIRSASVLSNAASGLSNAGSKIGSQVKGVAADIGQDIENSGEAGRQLMGGLHAARWVTGVVTGVATDTAVGSLKSVADATSSTVSSAKSVGAGTISISRTTWYYFFVLFGAGAAILALSTMFIPMVVVAPQQFSLIFTLGNVCILLSFSVLRGHVEFMKYMFDRSRIGVSGTYTISLLGTLLSSLYFGSYALTVVFAGVQVYALAWMLVSYIPGGTKALEIFTSFFGMVFKCCMRCASKGGPALPF